MYRLLFCGALLVLLLMSAGLAGCNEEKPTSETPTTDFANEDKNDTATPGVPLAELLAAVETGRGEALIDRIDPPVHIETRPVANRHLPSQTDTLRTLRYDGLTLEIYDVAGPGGRLIDHLIVTGRQYETAEGLHVGSLRADVEAALGPPDTRHGDTYVYERGDPVPNPLLIAFSGDIVSRMEWDFYVD